MAFKTKTHKGEGDWRPFPLVPRCALCILAMIIIDSFVVIMGIARKTKFVDLLLLSFVVLSLCWTTFFLIRPIFRSSPLHPGWAVGLDLICFPMIGTWSVIGAMQGLVYYEWLGVCSGYNVYRDGQCKSHSGVVSGLGWLAYTSGFLVTIIHFVLFLVACRDTHRYNSKKRDRKEFELGLELKRWKASPYSAINDSEERIPRVAVQPEFDTESPHSRSHSRNYSRTHSRSHSRSDSRRVSVTESYSGKPEHGVHEVGLGKRPGSNVPYEPDNWRGSGPKATEFP